MNIKQHYKSLEAMYLSAPINKYYQPKIEIKEGEAVIEGCVKDSMYHAAKAMHGSVYFKMLDDAAFFAASSQESDVFVLTSSFTTYLLRPVTAGEIRAVGRVVSRSKNQWVSESILYNKEKEVARGSGVFVRGRTKLIDIESYKNSL